MTNYGLSAINNLLTKKIYSSISCIKKCTYSTFLVPEDEEVISRDFKQQLPMEWLRCPPLRILVEHALQIAMALSFSATEENFQTGKDMFTNNV